MLGWQQATMGGWETLLSTIMTTSMSSGMVSEPLMSGMGPFAPGHMVEEGASEETVLLVCKAIMISFVLSSSIFWCSRLDSRLGRVFMRLSVRSQPCDQGFYVAQWKNILILKGIMDWLFVGSFDSLVLSLLFWKEMSCGKGVWICLVLSEHSRYKYLYVTVLPAQLFPNCQALLVS